MSSYRNFVIRMSFLAAACSCLALPGTARASAYEFFGTIVDADGAPIPDASVWVSQDRRVRGTRTDGTGAFQFDAVRTGETEVVAYKKGFAIGGATGYVLDDTETTIVLAPPGSIALRVVDKNFEPIAGARLSSLYVNDRFHVQIEDLRGEGLPSPRSGPDGILTIDYIPRNGFARMTVMHRSFAQASVPTLPDGSRLDLPMPFGAPLRGRVVDEEDEGVAHARVSVFRMTATHKVEFAEALSGPDGFFTALVPPNSYHVAVHHADYATPDPAPATLGVEGAAIADIVLPRAHKLVGRVVDVEDAPVAFTRIAYLREGVVFDETFSDSRGEFELVASSGNAVVRVSPPARMTTAGAPEIAVSLGSETEIELEPILLKPLPDLKGRVTSEDPGLRLDRVLVTARAAGRMYWTIPNDNGVFNIPLESLPPDAKVAVRAEHATRFLRADWIAVPEEEGNAELALAPFEPNIAPADESARNQLHHMVGKPAPELECDEWINASKDSAPLLASLRGKVVILTLWGGFDAVSGRARMEEMRALYELFNDDDGVAIVSVHDAGLEPPDILEYVNEYAIEFPVCCDRDPAITFDAYNTNIIPQTVIIDRNGIVRHFDVDGRILELIKDARRAR